MSLSYRKCRNAQLALKTFKRKFMNSIPKGKFWKVNLTRKFQTSRIILNCFVKKSESLVKK